MLLNLLRPGHVLLSGCMFVSISTIGQDIRYFKDEHGWTPAEEGKGRYMEVTTRSGDSTRMVEFKQAKSGRLLRTSTYAGQRPMGKWQVFDDSGKLTGERDFDILEYGSCDPAVADTADDGTGAQPTPATFAGGMEAMYAFMGVNMKYPDEAYEAGIQGKVYVRGRVDEHGDWQTLSICKGAHAFLDYEAWRVTESFPNWVPATKGGKAVASYYTLPVVFKLR